MTAWHTFSEGGVEIRFRDSTVVRWDAHPAFLHGLQSVQGTKAVDFAVLTPDGTVALVELKDFRDHETENRGRITGGELAQEVADKVRDSLAGMTWACKRPHSDRDIERVTGGFYRRDTPKLLVILWLDRNDKAGAAEAAILTGEIRKRLRPHIVARVVVTSLKLKDATFQDPQFGWIDAKSLPRRRSP